MMKLTNLEIDRFKKIKSMWDLLGALFVILALAAPGNAVSYPIDGDAFTETTTINWDIYENLDNDYASLNSSDFMVGSNSIQLISPSLSNGLRYDISDVNLNEYDYFVFWLKVNKSSIPWRSDGYDVYLDQAGANYWALTGNLPTTWTEYRLAKKDMKAGNFNSISWIHWDWEGDAGPIEVFIDGVHFEKILESYNDSAHNNIDNYFTGDEHRVYMLGEGLKPGEGYKIVYYDGDNGIVEIDNAISADSSGNVNSNHLFNSVDTPGTWHVELFNISAGPTSTFSGGPTYTYSGNPSALAIDDFYVEVSAIPEFPAGMIIPLAASLIIFVYMRHRISYGKK